MSSTAQSFKELALTTPGVDPVKVYQLLIDPIKERAANGFFLYQVPINAIDIAPWSLYRSGPTPTMGSLSQSAKQRILKEVMALLTEEGFRVELLNNELTVYWE